MLFLFFFLFFFFMIVDVNVCTALVTGSFADVVCVYVPFYLLLYLSFWKIPVI